MFCFLSRVVSPSDESKCVYKADLSPRPSRTRKAVPVSGGEDGCSWVGAGPVELFSVVVGAAVRSAHAYYPHSLLLVWAAVLCVDYRPVAWGRG